MNNKDLQNELSLILREENVFDMLLKLKAFEKDYKESDFYKQTHMKLMDAAKLVKTWNLINLDDVLAAIQRVINELDYSNLKSFLSEFTQALSADQKQFSEDVESLKQSDLLKALVSK